MSDEQLICDEYAARKLAHGCNIYTGPECYHATRSGATSAAAGKRWMDLRSKLINLGLTPLPVSHARDLE